ncbi:hypothetical protein MRX96_059676 [Rhipicephalus microplus]
MASRLLSRTNHDCAAGTAPSALRSRGARVGDGRGGIKTKKYTQQEEGRRERAGDSQRNARSPLLRRRVNEREQRRTGPHRGLEGEAGGSAHTLDAAAAPRMRPPSLPPRSRLFVPLRSGTRARAPLLTLRCHHDAAGTFGTPALVPLPSRSVSKAPEGTGDGSDCST